MELKNFAGQTHRQLAGVTARLISKLDAQPTVRVNLQGNCSIRTAVANLVAEGAAEVVSEELTETHKKGWHGNYTVTTWFVTIRRAR